MKAYIAAMAHETNTFSPIPTNIQSFRDSLYYDPETDADRIDITQMMGFQGFAAELEKRGYEAIVGPVAMAAPSGPLVRNDYETLRGHILDHLRKAGKVDIVFLFLHGAMLASGYDDCEGDLTRHVREIVGPKVPIGVLLDLHCDITEELIGAATVVAACKEYPHTDFDDRGREIVALLDRTRKVEIDPVMVRRFVPMISFFHTTNQPMRGLVDELFELEKDPILLISLTHGFPWSDSPYAGAHVLIVSDNVRQESEKVAEKLVEKWVPMRGGSSDKYVDLETALDRAVAAKKGPVVIADVADNPGGGAAADSTFILREVLDRKLDNVAMAIMWDPVAVDIARAAGEGAELDMRIGGKVSPQSGNPTDLHVTIGKISAEPHETLAGRDNVWIAVTSGGVDIVLTNVRTQVFTPDVFTQVGIDPAERDIVVVKSSQHFRAGFDPIAAETIYCDTPGTLNSDIASMPFKRVPRPIWPLDDIPENEF
jgi:microcystin degradation protein MlrC